MGQGTNREPCWDKEGIRQLPKIGLAVLILLSPVIATELQAVELESLGKHFSGESQDPSDATKVEFHKSYSVAMEAAKSRSKQLLICFDAPGKTIIVDRVRSVVEQDAESLIGKFEFATLPTDVVIKSKGNEQKLLRYPAFSEMRNRNGIAIIDFEDPKSPHYGRVVTVYPANGSRRFGQSTLNAIAKLPAGSLTQRSLVLAVLLHPERPQSVEADWSPVLAEEVEAHSLNQARLGVQGHHQWDMRFNRINGKVGGGFRAQEVCAESWPGQRLMEAAEECVDSWRQSSGHWSAVSGRQALFAYDLKLGGNGIWYATGIFAR